MDLIIQNVYSWPIRNVWFNLLLLIYILINTSRFRFYPFAIKLDKCIRSCNTQSNGLSNKVCVPNKRENLSIHVLIWLQEKLNQIFYQKRYYSNVNINLMVGNVIQIKSGRMIPADVSSETWKRLYLESFYM